MAGRDGLSWTSISNISCRWPASRARDARTEDRDSCIVGQLRVELGDDPRVEVGDGAAVPGQQHRETFPEHSLNPGWGPAQPQASGPCGGE